MSTDVQGCVLAVLNRIVQADWPNCSNFRKSFRKLLYSGSRTDFRLVSKCSTKQAKGPRKADPDGLFDLLFSDDQQMLMNMFEDLVLEVLHPLAHDTDAEASLPVELLSQALELGLTRCGVGEVHGGVASECITVTTVLIAGALAKGDLSPAAALLVSLSAANCIHRWGSPSQQVQWLPAFVSEEGALLTAIAANEPSLLLDPQKLATRAWRKGNHYLLSGERCLVLRGLEASRPVVVAKTDEGPASFLVGASAKGVERRAEPATGLKTGGTVRLRLKSVKVPADSRLAVEHFDYRIFLDHTTLTWCALALGIGQTALGYVVAHYNKHKTPGESISHRQGVTFVVADIAIELDVMRLIVWRARALAERGQPFQHKVCLARPLCIEKVMETGTDTMQLFGGHGFTREHSAKHWYHDLCAVTLMAGGPHL